MHKTSVTLKCIPAADISLLPAILELLQQPESTYIISTCTPEVPATKPPSTSTNVAPCSQAFRPANDVRVLAVHCH